MSHNDRNLMRRIQGGETVLFEQLVEKYRTPLLRFARSKASVAEEAEDLVQEAFFAAFQARDSYQPEFAFSTWLWTILLNLSRRWSRKSIREKQTLSRAAEIAPRGKSIPPLGLNNLLIEERHTQLIDLLSDLIETQADAIRLRFFGELSFQEIADTMNCSVSGAKKRVKTGLMLLAEQLREIEENER